ncbi:MAG: TolB family protein [Gemmatimonadaceae bacterium]
MISSALRVLPIFAIAAALAGCGSELRTAPTPPDPPAPPPPPPPPPRVPSMRIVAGANVTDTIDSRLLQSLSVEVRDSLGAPLRGVVVRFEALRGTQSFGHSIAVGALGSQLLGPFLADSTDAQGRVHAIVALGSAAGPARIALSAPTLGLADTARYTVVAGAAARMVIMTRDTALSVGKRFVPNARSADRYNNIRQDPLTYVSNSAACVVDTAGVIDARVVSRCLITVRSAVAVDSVRVTVVPQGSLVLLQLDFSGARGSVVTMALDGSNVRVRARLVTFDAFPSATHDASRIVFREQDHLYIVEDSAPPRRFVSASHRLAWEGWPRFAADGTWIYFAGGTGGNPNVYRLRPDGSTLEQITSGGSSNTTPDPSPDGTKLSYTGEGLIRIMTIGNASSLITSVRGTQPRWSPSGNRIAFLDAGSVNLINADGSNARQITAGVSYHDYSGLDWSADGNWIIARGRNTLDLINVATSEVLPLPFQRSYQAAFLR